MTLAAYVPAVLVGIRKEHRPVRTGLRRVTPFGVDWAHIRLCFADLFDPN